MVKVSADGRSRYSIKPIEEQLSFDKARHSHPLSHGTPAQHPLLTQCVIVAVQMSPV